MCDSKPIPHKHAEAIKAWADGKVIQLLDSSGTWVDLRVASTRRSIPSFEPNWEYRIKPEESDLKKYGAKAGDIWMVNGERLLFTFVVKDIGIDCRSLSSDTGGAFGWNWDKLRGGTLLYRANEVNKL